MRIAQILFVALVLFAALGPESVPAQDQALADFSNSPTAPLTAGERTLAIAVANEATVRVVAKGCEATVRGSGFVAADLLFTNAHLTLGTEELKVNTPDGPVLRAVERRSANFDIAVTAPVSTRQIRLATTDAIPGEPVIFAGHAGGGALVIDEGTVQLLADGGAYGKLGPVLLIDAKTTGGFSGGPVLNRRGELVAMLQGYDHITELTLAVPVKELQEWEISGGNFGSGACG